jgi:3-deoxy-D-manno-octulosonate 8-phosphate phosphatase (KDO 8-P phosphatase)
MPAAHAQLLLLDVDGVLTDGSIFLDDLGHETKRFHVRDGLGIKLWQRLGFQVGLITGRSGQVVQHRMKELGITLAIQGSSDKAASLDQLLALTGHAPEQVAYLGDDWPDLPVLRRVGYPMAVADADTHVKAVAHYITKAPGGRGAVREVIEHLLSAKNMLNQALDLYH